MVKASSKYLFTYSSLRTGFHKNSYNYITQYFTFVAKAKVKGAIEDADGELRGMPVGSDSYIDGELYELNNEHDFSFVFGQRWTMKASMLERERYRYTGVSYAVCIKMMAK